MHRRRGAGVLAGVGLLAALGYGAIPAMAAGRAPHAAIIGMRLGHVPTAANPMSATILMEHNAAIKGYTTPDVTISQGGVLSAENFDGVEHTVTSIADKPNGQPLFNTYVPPGTTKVVAGAAKLAPGTYDFHCVFHSLNMTGVLTVEGSGGGTHPSPQRFLQPLVTPKVLTGSHIRIPVERTKVRTEPRGPKTPMWTYGGSYPGPTIRERAGHDTKVTFVNRLPKPAGSISVHLHGDHHASSDDGQPDTDLIHHGASRTYDYPLTDNGKPERAAFDYYHDHRMDLTSRNNWRGLQGMFIVTDGSGRHLKLPGGRYDLPLLVADRSFTAANRLTDPFPSGMPSMSVTGPDAPPNDATVGNQVLVNGRVAPYKHVATHRYRLRLLNASNYTSYDFALSDGRPFVQIGNGDGLLPKPVVRQDITLGPAQRADVLVDFNGELGQRVELLRQPSTTPPTGTGSAEGAIMQFRVTKSVTDTSRVPSTLQKPPPLKAPKKVSAVWKFGLGGDADTTGSYWTVNGKPFNPHRVDIEVPLGATQTWLLENVSPITHYIHLHEEEWHTVSRDGKRPPPWERGLADTWRLDPGEKVKVAARFTDYTGVFMVHCHMLDHEDHGMMAQFAVVKPGTTKLPHGYFNSGSAVPHHATARTDVHIASATQPSSAETDASGMTGMTAMTAAGADHTVDIAAAPVARLTRAEHRTEGALGFESIGLLGYLSFLGWRRLGRPRVPA